MDIGSNFSKKALSGLSIEGGPSAIADAIYLSAGKALERARQDNSKRYALVLFSDTEERCSFYKMSQALELFKGTDLQIFTISYAMQASEKLKNAIKLSHQLALETGGASFVLNKKHTADELMTAIKAVILELRSQYIIGYTSINQMVDENPRKITVQIADGANGEKRQSYARESFIVPQN